MELVSDGIAESVAVAAQVLFYRADARLSILWGDPLGEGGGKAMKIDRVEA